MASTCEVKVLGSMRTPGMQEIHLQFSLAPAPRPGAAISYAAAAPADRRSSFTGSGLPFANERQAYEGTPNRGSEVAGDNGVVSVTLKGPPNAYYAGLGTLLVPPVLQVQYVDASGVSRRGALSLASIAGIPYRTNTYQRSRLGVDFYAVPDKLARSQPDILAASAYPVDAHKAAERSIDADFWHGKPPC